MAKKQTATTAVTTMTVDQRLPFLLAAIDRNGEKVQHPELGAVTCSLEGCLRTLYVTTASGKKFRVALQ